MTCDSDDVTPHLIAHMESFLGPIARGWTVDSTGASVPFQVVQYAGDATNGSDSFSTIGLSQFPLRSRTSGKRVRHELLMMVRHQIPASSPVGILQQVGTELIASHSALLRGDVVGPRGPLFEGSQMEALYSTIPVYLPDDFAACGDTVIAWLVPLSDSEAAFVTDHGWEVFESRLAIDDPDLTDVRREPLNLPR